MKRLFALVAAAAAFAGCPDRLTAQDFGNRTTEMREITAAELPKPAIPDIDVGDPIQPGPVPRPVYLVYRYYSCAPWYPFYIKDVFSSVVPRGQYHVEVDTAGAVNPGDNVEGQIVKDINHPGFGLYCITIRVGVPWAVWANNSWARWYIRWGYGAPYWCWQDHWWYYWQRPFVNLTLSGAQEVPPVVTQATATATVRLLGGDAVNYTLSWSGLAAGNPATQAHFHAPAPPGAPANVLVGIPNVTGTSGTVTGTVNSQALVNFLGQQSPPPNQTMSQVYINIHTVNNQGGELRGQVPVIVYNPIWCPWGPTWWPCTRWTRWGLTWGLTICHPYCYAWNPLYIPRPFCLYGMRYFYTPIGDVRQPAVGQKSPNAVPLPNRLNLAALAKRPWSLYNSVTVDGVILRPPFYYWPYIPYCSRWYWYRCLPFNLYRYNPPVVQFAIWQNPTGGQINSNFPDMPIQGLEGTMATITTRALVSQPADLNGDGLVNLSDLAAYRAENSTQAIDSFFDVFTEIE